MWQSLEILRVRETLGAGPAWSLSSSCTVILGPSYTSGTNGTVLQRVMVKMNGKINVKPYAKSFLHCV